MVPPECPDRFTVAIDDHHLVANAGLVLSVTLPQSSGTGRAGGQIR